VTLPWIIAGAAAGLLAGPRIRAAVFARSTAAGQPPRSTCPVCSAQILPGRWRWLSVLPLTGLFDGGRLDSGLDREIRLQDDELTGWTLAAPPEWDSLLAPHMARRVRACASALAAGTTSYLQHGWPLTDAL